jgi:hypothetical protein
MRLTHRQLSPAGDRMRPPLSQTIGRFRSHRAAALAAALALLPFAAPAKPVQGTPLAEAAAKAAHILLAEITDDTVSALRPGARVAARHASDIWEEFRILRVVRGGGEGLEPGDRLKVHARSNSCLFWKDAYFIRPLGSDVVEFREANDHVRAVVSPRYALRTLVVLFLEADRTHYGWFVSPTPLSPKVEKAVPGLKPAASEADPFGEPSKGTSPNCGPEHRLRLDIRLGSVDAFVELLRSLGPGQWFRSTDLADFEVKGKVDWERVRAAVRTIHIGGRTVYAVDYHPRNGPVLCGTFTVRATGDGHVAVFGCCGE